ncbi:MAG: class II aldolase/adducin family protein [Microcella pacifica]|uniref:class II aldolase/adducin family protein n=1 Tax=Microcella pacifica TaxID=2591847 RepID=UPI003315EA29
MTASLRALLADLSRQLGDPGMDAALLGEGNTSARMQEAMLIKASGATLASAEPDDFVRLELSAALALLDDPQAGDAEVDALFSHVTTHEGRRPSVESLLHVVLYEATDAQVIAHSHPTSVTALLCSQSAERLVDGALFPDQIVVLGAHPLLVPYVDPGIELARHARLQVADHITRWGEAPRVIYLRNHGMFALGSTASEVLGMTAMAQKCARAIIAASSAGGLVFMPPDEVARIDSRPDEKYRRALLSSDRRDSTREHRPRIEEER